MSKPAVVLEDVEVLCAAGRGQLLGDGLGDDSVLAFISRLADRVSVWASGLFIFLVTCLSLLFRYDREFSYQKLRELVIGDISQLLAVGLGNHELQTIKDASFAPGQFCGSNRTKRCQWVNMIIQRTAWPRLRGLMSRKAKALSFSKSLKHGISPIGV